MTNLLIQTWVNDDGTPTHGGTPVSADRMTAIVNAINAAAAAADVGDVTTDFVATFNAGLI